MVSSAFGAIADVLAAHRERVLLLTQVGSIHIRSSRALVLQRICYTDLDLQLKKHGIHQLILVGVIAHTCVEATVRFAAELGYEVTVVKDATASYSDREMRAALEVNIPNYASGIVTTKEVVDAISSL